VRKVDRDLSQFQQHLQQSWQMLWTMFTAIEPHSPKF
jgi:hypothetical protein